MDAVSRVLMLREQAQSGFGRGLGASVLAHVSLVILCGLAIRVSATPPLEPGATAWIVPVPKGALEPSAGMRSTIARPPAAPAAMRAAHEGTPRHASRQDEATSAQALAAGDSGHPGGTQDSGAVTLAPGSPFGTQPTGDWYLAIVQAGLWTAWASQLMESPGDIVLQFTIGATGEVTDVALLQSSGSALVDRAAYRALAMAGPFARLPSTHGERMTIRAVFTSKRPARDAPTSSD